MTARTKIRKPRPDTARTVRRLVLRVAALELAMHDAVKDIDRLERARAVLAEKITKIENTRPGWAKDMHGNPLPVYTSEDG
jgi:hypothetical protein